MVSQRVYVASGAFIALVMAFCVALYTGDMWFQTNALRKTAAHLGVAPSKIALHEHVVAQLEARRGAPREEIHAFLETIGGEVTFRIGTRGTEREDAYWTMGRVPWGYIWTLFILKYDSNGRLQSVSTGSS